MNFDVETANVFPWRKGALMTDYLRPDARIALIWWIAVSYVEYATRTYRHHIEIVSCNTMCYLRKYIRGKKKVFQYYSIAGFFENNKELYRLRLRRHY